MKKEIIEQIGSELSRHQQFIETSFPSIYSREDVQKLISEFAHDVMTIVSEAKEKRAISLEGVEELSNLLCGAINARIERLDSNDVVDFDSVSLSISYNNQVEIDSIDYISDTITNEVESAVEEVLHDFFSPEEKEEEVVSETPYATEQ